ncbi:MAG: GNAT family N-acetyltransferase [Bellilinea sp.]
MNGPYHFYSPNIRPLQKRKDLAAVANLVELCFAETMDPDGREYIKHLRWLAQGYTGWGANPFERLQLPVQGFLWEEDQIIVGNLTLIPFSSKGRKYFLIANVATHPGYRQRGIARKLTLTALDYARTHGAASAWLHVRDDNPVAIALYESLGFAERLRRTIWQCDSYIEPGLTDLQNGVQVGRRQPRDWQQQSAWLDRVYPPEVSWNLPLNKNRLEPGMLKSLQLIMSGEQVVHLAARKESELIGLVTWEPSRMYADTLWLATDPDSEDAAVQSLMIGIQKAMRRKRPLMANYPAEHAQSAFINSGFAPHMTLIWMETGFSSEGV